MGQDRALADARTGQRRARLGVGRVTGQDPFDHPLAVPADQIGAEQTDRTLVVRRALVAAGRGDIRVGGAQFAEDLAQQIRELVGGGDPFDQRTVLVEHPVPVDAAQVRLPEIGPDNAPRLVERLAPLRPGVDIVQDPAHVEIDGRIAVTRLGGGYGAQLALVHDDQPRAVAARREPVQMADEFALARLRDVEVFEGGAARQVGGVGEGLAERAGDRPAQPDQTAAADRVQRGVLRRGDGERGDAVGQPLDLDGDRTVAGLADGRIEPAGGGRPSGDSAKGDGVAEESGTR